VPAPTQPQPVFFPTPSSFPNKALHLPSSSLGSLRERLYRSEPHTLVHPSVAWALTISRFVLPFPSLSEQSGCPPWLGPVGLNHQNRCHAHSAFRCTLGLHPTRARRGACLSSCSVSCLLTTSIYTRFTGFKQILSALVHLKWFSPNPHSPPPSRFLCLTSFTRAQLLIRLSSRPISPPSPTSPPSFGRLWRTICYQLFPFTPPVRWYLPFHDTAEAQLIKRFTFANTTVYTQKYWVYILAFVVILGQFFPAAGPEHSLTQPDATWNL
jgi:hypothetical protein